MTCDGGHTTTLEGGVLWADRPSTAAEEAGEGTTAATLRSFGYEWNAFPEIEDEDERFWRRYVEPLAADGPLARLALDAGCGKGRFSYFTAQHVEALIALDGSRSVIAASHNLVDRRNVAVVRADLRTPPIGPGTIDLITCLGVLHHLDDPRQGFDALARLLAPDGRILIYVYSRPAAPGVRSLALTGARGLRRLTTRLPHRALRRVALPIAMGLYLAFVLPGRLGARFGVRQFADLPLATYRGAPLRSLWLDTFDRLSAPVEHRYRPEEIVPWFDQNGLSVEASRESPDLAGIVMLGRRRSG